MGRGLLIVGVIVGLIISRQGSHVAVTTTTQTSTTTSATSGTTTTTNVVVPPFVPKYNIRSSVTPRSCRHSGHQWTYSGSVRNNQSRAVRVHMVFDFLNTKTAAVAATRVVFVPRLAARARYRWSVSATTPPGPFGCAVRFAEASPVK